jgi:hypothetical protein
MPASTIRFSRRSRPPDRTVPSRRIGTGGADGAGRRLNAWRGDADRVRDRTQTGGTRRRRRQQPVLGGAVAPHRHAGARGAADADARARSRRHDQEQAGAVIELVIARRGLFGGEVRRAEQPGCQLALRNVQDALGAERSQVTGPSSQGDKRQYRIDDKNRRCLSELR